MSEYSKEYKKRKKRHKRRRNRKFRIGATIYLLSLALAIVIVIIVLWNFLVSFQKSLPEDAIKNYVAQLNENFNEALEYHIVVAKGENPEEVIAAVESLKGDEPLTYSRDMKASTELNPVYSIKCNDKIVLKVGLEVGNYVGFGRNGWQLLYVTVADGAKSYTDLQARVPQTAALYVDDKIVAFESASEPEDIELLKNLKSQGYLQEIPAEVTYSLGDFYTEPKIAVFDANGNEIALTKQSEEENQRSNSYVTDYTASDEFVASVSDRVLQTIEPYALYQSNDVGFSTVSQYLLSGSELYERVRSSDTQWFVDHSSTSFSNKNAQNYKQYSENCFSCDVSFVQTVTTYNGDNVYEGNYSWIFIKSGDQWYLADMITR